MTREPPLKFIEPRSFFAAVEAEMVPLSNEKFFNDPKHQHLRDRWCAGSFGVGYSLYIEQCSIAMQPLDRTDDVDFFLKVGKPEFPFQTVEVQKPGRRRGHEYRRPPTLTPYRPAAEGDDGPGWLRSGVKGKLDKHYATAKHLNLLVYANFNAEQLEWATVAEALAEFEGHFASLWVMAHHVLGSVFSTPELGAVGKCKAWCVTRDLSA